MKSGNLNFLERSGHLGPVTGLIYTGEEVLSIKPRTNQWKNVTLIKQPTARNIVFFG